MRRGLLNIITVVSLLVGLVAAGLWVRGYYVTDLVRVRRMDWRTTSNIITDSVSYVANARGRVTWQGGRNTPPTGGFLQRDYKLRWQEMPPGNPEGDSIWLGWVEMAAMGAPLVWIWRRRGKNEGGRRRTFREWVAAGVMWMAAGVFVTTAVFWGRSYPYFERVDWKLWSELAGVQVNSSMGSLMVAWTNKGPNWMIAGGEFAFVRTCIPESRGPLYEAAGLVGPYTQLMGFTLGTDQSTSWVYNVLIVPYWFLEAIVLGIGVMAWRYVHRRKRWKKQGLCPECGYDLRATPERCPECGAATTEQEATEIKAL